MKPGLTICKGSLYLYGGEYENGSKQYTFNDFYALGMIGFCCFFLPPNPNNPNPNPRDSYSNLFNLNVLINLEK